jgi:hypothetical protein
VEPAQRGGFIARGAPAIEQALAIVQGCQRVARLGRGQQRAGQILRGPGQRLLPVLRIAAASVQYFTLSVPITVRPAA